MVDLTDFIDRPVIIDVLNGDGKRFSFVSIGSLHSSSFAMEVELLKLKLLFSCVASIRIWELRLGFKAEKHLKHSLMHLLIVLIWILGKCEKWDWVLGLMECRFIFYGLN